MSTMDKIILDIADNMPKFNEYALKTFVRKQINSAPDFIDMVYREAVKLVNGVVVYHGYDILTPTERIEYELNVPQAKKPMLQVAISELQLVRFKFTYDGVYYYTHFYTPYLLHDMLVVNGKHYGLIKTITDQVFSHTKNGGLQVRPIRHLLEFNRSRQFRLTSVHRGVLSSEFIIQAGLWHKRKQGKRLCDFTVLHYLLCKYGFTNTMLKFGLSGDDIKFTDYVGPNDDQEYDYFAARISPKKGVIDLYLRVRSTLLVDTTIRKLVANLLYLLTHFGFQTVETLMTPDGHDFRVMLGRILNAQGSHDESKARSDADNHIVSVDHFIDPLTKARFHTFGLKVDNIYDLLLYIFVEIDRFLVNSIPNDLLTKRIDVIEGTLIPAFASTIFRAFYNCQGKIRLQKRDIQQLFYNRPMAVAEIYSSRRRSSPRTVNPHPEQYGDNWLLASGIFKLRPGGTSSERFHPSMCVVESIIAFTGATPGMTGLINPYCTIGPEGGFIRPDYAEDVEEILQYLPSA